MVDPETIFDSQIKRIHEYKRQLLNVLHVLVLYNRLRENPGLDVPPRTVFFAGKAAPAYTLAKRIIHLINNVAAVIDADPAVRGRLKVLFLPEYNVSLAQRLIPASDISEQISTAGYEASGTSNMKFMMNGALTVGTRDGATIEMAEAAGEENFFLFGLTAEQVQDSRGWYDPRWHDEHEPETHRALDLIRSGAFDRGEPGVFRPIVDTLLTHGDHYMHLADLASYVKVQEQAGALYQQPDAWARQGHRERRPLRQVLQRSHDHANTPEPSGARNPARSIRPDLATPICPSRLVKEERHHARLKRNRCESLESARAVPGRRERRNQALCDPAGRPWCRVHRLPGHRIPPRA